MVGAKDAIVKAPFSHSAGRGRETMPTSQTLEAFIARVEANAHAEAVEEMEMEELAYQRWEGERVAEEKFFYDPAQLTPKTP
jgi:hypothetical protein